MEPTSEMIEACFRQIKRLKTQKNINTKLGSYSLKHWVEREEGIYICEEAFIEAAKISHGVIVERDTRLEKRCCFNFSMKSYRANDRLHDQQHLSKAKYESLLKLFVENQSPNKKTKIPGKWNKFGSIIQS